MQSPSPHVEDDPGPQRAGSAASQAQGPGRRAGCLALRLHPDRATAPGRSDHTAGAGRARADDRSRGFRPFTGRDPAARARAALEMIVIDASALVSVLRSLEARRLVSSSIATRAIVDLLDLDL